VRAETRNLPLPPGAREQTEVIGRMLNALIRSTKRA
jgi:hypothetical protein